MELKDEHGAILAKLTFGAIYAPSGEIIAQVSKNIIKDPTGTILGYVRHGMVSGPNGEGLALYSNNTVSTYSKSSTLIFTGNVLKDVSGKVIMRLSEDYLSYMEVLTAYIVFFSELWHDQKHSLALSAR